jgi:hypothetical protein
MNLRNLAARRDPDCTDRRPPNLADHRIWGCLVAAIGAASTYRIGPLSVFQDEAVVAHVTTGALPLALLQRRGSSSPMAMRRASPPSRPGTTSSSRAKPQHRDHLQPMPNCNADCSAWPGGSAVPATPASSPSIRRIDLAMTKATGVIKVIG